MGINFDLNKGINDKESGFFVRSIILASMVFFALIIVASFFTKKDASIGPKGISVTTPESTRDSGNKHNVDQHTTIYNIKGDYVNGNKTVNNPAGDTLHKR